MSDGVTCKKRNGRLSAFDFETKRRIHERLHPGEPMTPPKVCAECVWGTILTMDDGGAEEGGPK